MLTAAEYDDIKTRLLRVVATVASPRQTLAAAIPGRLAERLPDGEPRILVERVLALCTEDAYHDDPPAVVVLLELLLPLQVATTVARLRTPPPPAPDPFEALIMISKLPFLDRQSTRAALRDFLEIRPTRPVMVVTGPSGFGKTYTGDFVDHVLSARRGIQHCRIPLEEGQGPSTGAEELARDLVTILGGDPAQQPPKTTNGDRWAKDLANWVLSVANNSGFDWWFLLDGFNGQEVRRETQTLITKLAFLMTTGVSRDRHRLILTDFDRSALTIRPGMIAAEETRPIPFDSVRAAIAVVLGHAGIAPDDQRAVVAEAEVLQGFADPVTDLAELALRLSDLAEVTDHRTLTGSTTS
ncbi:hypothetical protein BJ973_002940 [Actinoplanes tereljensis]|uniref:Uncharacterized protein n=1 Tax=Paractinoplanes tereljensis TaxID=571912 RepID=A0A919NS76_9ACTN|nr:hypothetical protein [Actinoplanes tereljensis]GIF22617.1 hypothetical protein Ate02nite_53470 [Actinoplanes tereljensis]